MGNINVYKISGEIIVEIKQVMSDYELQEGEVLGESPYPIGYSIETGEMVLNRPLSEEKSYKLEKLSLVCGQTIEQGILFNGKNYSAKIEDQVEISQMYITLKSAANSIQISTEITEEEKEAQIKLLKTSWHADGEGCEIWSGVDFISFAEKMKEHVVTNKAYFGGIKDYFKTLNESDIEVIKDFEYGDALPEDIQSIVDANIQANLTLK